MSRLKTVYQKEIIQSFFPNERVDFIHGQQNSKELEKNLLGFFDGDISVLVCSTIIESGLDVSNANCIIINDPQNLGLSQLYQIRGRVGRGSRQASCYLFIPKKTKLSEKAHRRLKTIERHTSLGSGYNIATNDLDIRGGGAVFGYKQSGQISKIGFAASMLSVVGSLYVYFGLDETSLGIFVGLWAPTLILASKELEEMLSDNS